MTATTITVRARLDGTVEGVAIPTNREVQVVVQRPLLHILEVAQVSFFEGREILLPDVEVLPADAPGPDRVPGIDVAAAAFRFLDAHRDKKLLVVGHTDTVGSKKSNQTLSEDRARNVFLYLSGDADAWAAHCQQHHEVEDLQRILAWVHTTVPGFDCDPGPIDDDLGPQTREALYRFRDGFAQHAGVPGGSGTKVCVADWKSFAHLYDDAVAERLGSSTRLRDIRELAPFAPLKHLGLGERYPTENPQRDSFESERNRRVELVFLDRDELVYVEDAARAEELLYSPDSIVRREWLAVGFPARSDELAVKVQTEDGEPVSGVNCTLTLSTGEVLQALLDASGIARFFGVPRLAATFRLPSIEAIDWDAELDGQRPLPAAPEEDDEDGPEDDGGPPMITPAMRACLDLGDEDDDGADDEG